MSLKHKYSVHARKEFSDDTKTDCKLQMEERREQVLMIIDQLPWPHKLFSYTVAYLQFWQTIFAISL